MTVTLAVDFGSKYIGLALVRNHLDHDEPLFAGTITYQAFALKKTVEPRAQLRRIRRTRKTKKARLRKLEQALINIGTQPEAIHHIVGFCKRRGYLSLWDKPTIEADESKEQQDDEALYRFSREDFFHALEKEIERLVPAVQDGRAVLRVCEKIFNRAGRHDQEIRPLRIDNRGVSRCAWDGCDDVTPRRSNAIRDALAQFVFTVYKEQIIVNPDLKMEIEGMLERVEVLAKRYHNAAGHDPKKERSALWQKILNEIKPLQSLSKEKEAQETNQNKDTGKAWGYNRDNIKNLVTRQTGRNRYCREHSTKYVEYLLNG